MSFLNIEIENQVCLIFHYFQETILSQNETKEAIEELVEQNNALTVKVDDYILQADSKFVNVENMVQNQLEEGIERLNNNLTNTNDLIENVRRGINECTKENLCQNGGTCLDLELGYTCQCLAGTTG